MFRPHTSPATERVEPLNHLAARVAQVVQMSLLATIENSDYLELLQLDVHATARLSECSHAATQATASAQLWSTALRELKRQHHRAGLAAEQAAFPHITVSEPRIRLGLAMRLVGRDTSHLHRFFSWQCDQASAFDMGADPEQEDDEYGLAEQGDVLCELRERNRPRYNLMNDVILLHMASDDMLGAHRYYNTVRKEQVIQERDNDEQCLYFSGLLDAASDADVGDVARGQLHPCDGSSFSRWWCGYVFEMCGTGEGAGERGPAEGLEGIDLGTDAHLDFLVRDPPCFLTPSLWGEKALAHLDVLHPVRLRLADLKAAFPYTPVPAARVLPFSFPTFAAFDAFLIAHPNWLALETWAAGAAHHTETSDDDEDEDGL